MELLYIYDLDNCYIITIKKGTPSDVKDMLKRTPHKDCRTQTNYVEYDYEPNKFAVDRGRKIRPSDWYVRGSDDYKNDVTGKQ